MLVFNVATSKNSQQTLRLAYVDGNGKETRRDVEVHRVYEDRIIGKCLLRGSSRTFLKSRVLLAIDLDTGEIIKEHT